MIGSTANPQLTSHRRAAIYHMWSETSFCAVLYKTKLRTTSITISYEQGYLYSVRNTWVNDIISSYSEHG